MEPAQSVKFNVKIDSLFKFKPDACNILDSHGEFFFHTILGLFVEFVSTPDLQSSSHTFGLDMASTLEASAANTGSGVTANDKFFMSSLLNLSQQPTSANNTRSGTNSILICLLSENNIDLTGRQINDPPLGI